MGAPRANDAIWAAYEPTPEVPWNLARVVHLHRRASFAATWQELQRDLADGPAATVDRLLDGQSRAHGVPADFEQVAGVLGDAAVVYRDPTRLKAWWIYRMLNSPDPLGERLTLLWHNHFATSDKKVRNLAAMRRQNELFRELSRAPFGHLLERAVRDPALLVWLDAPANHKGNPNENLARELMELFSLGIGHYTEGDVKEAARALTGWTVTEGRFANVPALHDAGEKTILGRSGSWRGEDLVHFLLEHPATAERLAWRICDWLMGESGVDPAAVTALAAELREHDLHVGWGVERVLRSQLFFAEANLASRVLSPVEYVVGVPRALEMFDPPPSSLVLAEWLGRLGQDLFYPPNVGGWPGGRFWLSTRTLVERANFASALAWGKLAQHAEPFDAAALASRHGRDATLSDVLHFLGELLLGRKPEAAWVDRILSAAQHGTASPSDVTPRAVALLLSLPEVHQA